uniref:Plac8 onzin related protein 6 n=1 Tax=Xiphophorus maculatus TaxID=8083 RepID=A0A3B5QI11_XIPMA
QDGRNIPKQTGLFDCFEDVNTFKSCYGFWCCPGLACTVSGRFGENYCLPLCDILTPSVCVACGVPMGAPRCGIFSCACFQGSLCGDIFASCFCVWCSWCQMHRKLKEHIPVVVVMQQPMTPHGPTVVNVHANPVMMFQSKFCSTSSWFSKYCSRPCWVSKRSSKH